MRPAGLLRLPWRGGEAAVSANVVALLAGERVELALEPTHTHSLAVGEGGATLLENLDCNR